MNEVPGKITRSEVEAVLREFEEGLNILHEHTYRCGDGHEFTLYAWQYVKYTADETVEDPPYGTYYEAPCPFDHPGTDHPVIADSYSDRTVDYDEELRFGPTAIPSGHLQAA